MKIGTKYCIKATNVPKFIDMSFGNEDIVDKIKKHGGHFTVLDIYNCSNDGSSFVTKVMMADGTKFSAENYENYFELSDSEFEFFEEYFEKPETDGGLMSMCIEVNQKNFEAMIELIKKNFSK